MDAHQNRPPLPVAADPEFQELIDYFVGELPNRVSELENAVTAQDAGMLRMFAHRLKGAAPGFGFDEIGSLAGELEGVIDRHGGPDASLEHARNEIARLLSLCRSYCQDT